MKISPSAIALSATAIVMLAMCSSATSENTPQAPQRFSAVVSPEVPPSVELCGQVIDLDRSDMWERYDRELTSIAYTHGTTLLTIKRANKYFPVMAPILKENGVPDDLLYLACAESNLNPRAVSSAKAAGIWQFMSSTASQYGLEVNDEVDERYNLEKSTAAAARLLKSLHKKYGDWPSAMAAYNGGPARISNELSDQMVATSLDAYLVEETSRYVFRIAALKEILEHPSKYGYVLTVDQLYQPVEYDEVKVTGPVASWPQWAKSHGITFAQLREANPWIRAKKLTNKKGSTYTVKIPKQDALSRSRQPQSVYNPDWLVGQ